MASARQVRYVVLVFSHTTAADWLGWAAEIGWTYASNNNIIVLGTRDRVCFSVCCCLWMTDAAGAELFVSEKGAGVWVY